MQKATVNPKGSGVKLPPALDPERPALTQPWRDFVSKGFLTEIGVKFTGTTTEMFVTVGDAVTVPEKTARTGVPAGQAKQWIIDSKLWTPGKASKSQSNGIQLPSKTLVKKDFEGTDEELSKRASAVAKALGDTAARGRIGSLKYMRRGIDTFEKWWTQAPGKAKTRLLMELRHHKDLTDEDHTRFANVVKSCPFRGFVPTPSEEEEPAKPKAANGTATD